MSPESGHAGPGTQFTLLFRCPARCSLGPPGFSIVNLWLRDIANDFSTPFIEYANLFSRNPRRLCVTIPLFC